MRWLGMMVLLMSGTAFGQLFAVAPGPRLVTVDADTGQVTEIGAMESGIRAASMEFVGRRLFALDTNYPNGAWLIELDTTNGSTLSRHAVTLDGEGIQNGVEGLGYDAAAGSLVQGFWRPDSSGPAGSNTLGYLGTDGSITSPAGYGAMADFDGLAARGEDGSMYWVDREPGVDTVEIGVVTLGGPMSSLVVFAFDGTLNGVNDVTLAPDRGELLAVDAVTRRVHRFDPVSAALLGSVEVSTDENLNSAAYRLACAADLAPPFGLLDLADVVAFVSAFAAMEPAADLAEPYGLFDLEDVTAFVHSFNTGCP